MSKWKFPQIDQRQQIGALDVISQLGRIDYTRAQKQQRKPGNTRQHKDKKQHGNDK